MTRRDRLAHLFQGATYDDVAALADNLRDRRLAREAADREAAETATAGSYLHPDRQCLPTSRADGAPLGWPKRCARCKAPWTEIGFDYAEGFNCRACGGSDADE